MKNKGLQIAVELCSRITELVLYMRNDPYSMLNKNSSDDSSKKSPSSQKSKIYYNIMT